MQSSRYLKTIAAVLLGLSTSFALADNGPVPSTDTAPQSAAQPMLVPSPPNVPAKAYVLMDVDSGKIIAEKNMDERRAPASLTKLMTLYLTSRALHAGVIKTSDKVLISKKAWQTGGSRMFVKVNSQVPVDMLTQGIIVDSGNDATMALAQFVGGSIPSFVQMMNQQAQALGMKNTHYTDPTGLPAPKHYSSAHDLGILARAIWLEFPEYHAWYGEKWLTYNNIRQPNRNRLLWRYPYAKGMKTGHTDEAGYCLIAEADKNGMRLISVVMGAPTDEDRSSDSIRLLEYGFRFYNTHLLYQGGSVVATPRIWFGDKSSIPAGVLDSFYVTMPHGQFQKAKVNVQMDTNIHAPIAKGQQLGTVTVSVDGNVVETRPLVALEADSKGGWWRYSTDAVGYKFHQWFGSKDETVKVAKPADTPAPAAQTQPAPTAADASTNQADASIATGQNGNPPAPSIANAGKK
ncbi:MAG: serine-type D-Ala-D-Ala carboxypeptidase [Gammaproteobacteria bacterium CG11_big_fil_rev_8_21_14_0_20_46_22]|nr:MAG: serine-type D-Ala-D-Ala carboxypeptidase [Gammaproteobacteria bacterium CG12_big_fil_rev_8_21_14_0_65_46_12]PIR10914.1 MAG: serine-type D-Ala-D-Ala carboxypeptidase [Gammaproteobacteria bacterium CG11_big_fil_rev_8_21_14_0_20_46_22]